jgi:protocatechuate 3,4-dioxygenase alpha subunit
VKLPRTPSQTVGPYYAIGMCRRPENELVADGASLTGRLLDGAEMPVSDGVVEIWDAANRRWGRCGTDSNGMFMFVVDEVGHLDAHVFARGLLRHQLTRIYLTEEPQDARLSSLVAERLDDEYRFDIRLQGERQTVFFAV